MHPTKPVFWILAAAWEFEENGNMNSARGKPVLCLTRQVLLQRGIRINPESQQLWIEYFKLEMLWIEKIKERRRILFKEQLKEKDQDVLLVHADKEDNENEVDLPVLEIEKDVNVCSFSNRKLIFEGICCF